MQLANWHRQCILLQRCRLKCVVQLTRLIFVSSMKMPPIAKHTIENWKIYGQRQKCDMKQQPTIWQSLSIVTHITKQNKYHWLSHFNVMTKRLHYVYCSLSNRIFSVRFARKYGAAYICNQKRIFGARTTKIERKTSLDNG